jgi:cell cycle sensor histidine kinase DivJ
LTAEDVIDAAVLRLTAGGEVLDACGRVAELLDLHPALLLGNGLFERIHVGDRVGYLCALSDLREGEALRKLELRLRVPRTNAGEVTYRHFAAEIATAATSDAATIMVVLRPNDETAALRAEIARLKSGADEADIAKSRFLAVVSHELRTPLNAIVGFSDMLAEEMFGGYADARQKEYVGLIRESGRHLHAVVSSILDVSKIACGSYPIDPQPFRFAEAVEVCRKMISLQAAGKVLTLDTELAPSVGNIVADRRAVQQMLINLLSNAVKFTPAGGLVTVGANRLGSRLHFWVSDTGIGISEDDLGRLGRPFTQVRNDLTREYDGAGLGLSLVKGLVELHQGSMMIESAPGEGTVVTVSLPIAGPSGRSARDAGNVIQLNNDEVADGQARKIA